MKGRKLNILQLLDSLAVGGAEMMAVNIANGLAKEELYESHLVVTRKEGELKEKLSNNVKYYFIKKKSKIDFKSIIYLKKYIDKHKINVIHTHSSSFFYGTLMKMITPKIKLIWHDHYGKSEELNKRSFFVLLMCSFYFNSIISVNKILQNWAKNNLKCKNVFYFENFAVLDFSEIKTILKGESGKKIVCIAGYRPQKNHLNLIQAFYFVIKKHPDWTLHLIGKGYGDIYHQQINELILKLKLSENVYQYGVRSDVGNILLQVEIGVLSSDSEGLPISLLEYGLAELAVVVTNVGECANVLESGNHGLIVQPKNSVELSEKIQLLIEDENLRNTLGKSLLQHVESRYSENSFIKKLKRIY